MSIFRKRRKIQFTDKTHPLNGMISTGLGIVCLIVTIMLFVGAGKAKGNAPIWYGYVGMLTMFATFAGLVIGIRCFQKEDIYYLTPTIGTVINGILTVLYLILIFVGVF